jgi:DNA-binding MarR family transcriptional regulator
VTPKPFSAETLPEDLARGAFPEIRQAMLEFVGQFLLDFERAAERLGLTLAQARVLGFTATRPMSMREIAEQWGCDPSNITAKVDRLVDLGLAERRPDPRDGRVNLVAATPQGVQTARELCAMRDWVAATLSRLEPKDVDTVRAALKLLVRV